MTIETIKTVVQMDQGVITIKPYTGTKAMCWMYNGCDRPATHVVWRGTRAFALCCQDHITRTTETLKKAGGEDEVCTV